MSVPKSPANKDKLTNSDVRTQRSNEDSPILDTIQSHFNPVDIQETCILDTTSDSLSSKVSVSDNLFLVDFQAKCCIYLVIPIRATISVCLYLLHVKLKSILIITEACPTVTFSITNKIWSVPALNSSLHVQMPAYDYEGYGTSHKCWTGPPIKLV
jgi:hypothetical protein